MTLLPLYASIAVAGFLLLPRLQARLLLSKAKHRSLAGHPRISRRLARLIPFYEYSDARFFDVDGAPAQIAGRRRASFERLSQQLHDRAPDTLRLTDEIGAI